MQNVPTFACQNCKKMLPHNAVKCPKCGSTAGVAEKGKLAPLKDQMVEVRGCVPEVLPEMGERVFVFWREPFLLGAPLARLAFDVYGVMDKGMVAGVMLVPPGSGLKFPDGRGGMRPAFLQEPLAPVPFNNFEFASNTWHRKADFERLCAAAQAQVDAGNDPPAPVLDPPPLVLQP